jgi:hypothetical protein
MLDKAFPAVLTKHTHFYEEDDVFVKFSIRFINEGDIQTFIDSFDQKVTGGDLKRNFDYPIIWKKIVLDTTDYEKTHFKVQFDEVEFDADLIEIAVNKKSKKGVVTFEYIMTFIKDVGEENEDSRFAKSYLKYKEEDENGKKKLIEFDVTLTIEPIKNVASKSGELF